MSSRSRLCVMGRRFLFLSMERSDFSPPDSYEFVSHYLTCVSISGQVPYWSFTEVARKSLLGGEKGFELSLLPAFVGTLCEMWTIV